MIEDPDSAGARSGAEDEQLLILSDLHLSEGRHPVSGRVSRHEDFFFDEEFADFLSCHLSEAPWSSRRWKLIINGDFIDFLQVTSLPDSAQKLDLRLDPEYGLGTGPEETVWKLQAVVRGHARFFDALAGFAVNHKVVVITGNHDIEFWHPQVQVAFKSLLADRLEGSPEQLEDQRCRLHRHLEFRHWFYFDGLVYVEHGHQYDVLNSFKYYLDPRLPLDRRISPEDRDHLDLPWGSFFVRYLFNKVELDIPYADNIKPTTRFLFWFIRNRPGHAYAFLLGDGREMLRRMKRRWFAPDEEAYAPRRRAHGAALQELAAELAASQEGSVQEWVEKLEAVDRLSEPPVMREPRRLQWKFYKLLTGPVRLPALVTFLVAILLLGSLLCLLRILQPALPLPVIQLVTALGSGLAALFPGSWAASAGLLFDTLRWIYLAEILFLLGWFIKRRLARYQMSRSHVPLRQKAAQIEAALRPRYIVMGHIHEPDLWRLPGGATYFNTSTWTKIFNEEERLIREEKEFVFLRILRRSSGDLSARLMKWEGPQRRARLLYLFAEQRQDLFWEG